MKSMISSAAAAAMMVAALAGCGSSSPAPQTHAQQLTIAKGTAQGCLQKGSQFTPAGRAKIKLCAGNAVLAKNEHVTRACTGRAISATVPAQGQTRYHAVQNAIAACLVRYSH